MRRGGWSLLCSVLLVSVLLACDPAATHDGGAATDAEAPGVDAGADAGGLPGAMIAEGVCEGDRRVAVAPDGARLAFVTCEGDAAVWVAPLPDGAPAQRVDDARPTTTVELSPDGRWILYTDAEGTNAAVRRADLSEPAVTLAAPGGLREARFVVVDAAGTPELRLLTRHRVGSASPVVVRRDTDGFASAITLLDDAGASATLALVSGSRGTLIVRVEAGAARSYQLVPTGGGAAPTTLPIDPTRLAMGPVGMGDTHGLARAGDGLAFVEFATGAEVALEAGGVAPDVDWLVLEAGGERVAYYLRNGDPTRRLRDGGGASLALADAEATDLWATPHGDALIYPSGGRVFRLVDGGSPVDLGPYAPARLTGAHAPTASLLALVDGGALRVFPTDGSGAADVESGVVPTSVGYDGVGARLLWRAASDDAGHADVLRAADLRELAPTTLAWDVTGHWAVPGSSQIVFRAGGALHLR